MRHPHESQLPADPTRHKNRAQINRLEEGRERDLLRPLLRTLRPAHPGAMASSAPGTLGGVEIRNHGRKGACLYEDKTRSRNPALVGALAMLCNILLCTHKEQEKQAARPGFVEEISADNHKAFPMLMRRY